jgi:methyl-accepting chemotaxis protein
VNKADMKVATRLSLGFGLVLLLMVLLVAAGLFRFDQVGTISSRIVDQDWAKVEAVNTINSITRANARNTLELFIAADAAQAAKIYQRIDANKKLGDDAAETLQKLIYAPEGKDLLVKVKDARSQYIASFQQIKALLQENKRDEAMVLMNTQTLLALDNLQEPINALLALQGRLAAASGAEIKQNIRSASMLMLALGSVALAIGLLAGFLITRRLLTQLGGEPGYAVIITQQIAAGDLSGAIETRKGDQSSLLFAISAMRDSLAAIVTQVRKGTDTIATASGQIAAGNLDLSARTEQQASSLEETASSMEQLTSTVKQNSDNAQQANQLVLSAAETAQKGGAVVAQVVQTMSSINQSSRKIVDIIGVIDSIAFQTNILALNAAVEAARAGEQGRGFAVVATEVRNLAQRSAAAAKEIKTLIGDSVDKVSVGNALVEQAGVTMSEVVASVKHVTDIMGEITMAGREQRAGIEQINLAVTEMDTVTQQNAALVEEAAAAAEALQDQATHLAQVVSIFRLAGANDMAALPHGRQALIAARGADQSLLPEAAALAAKDNAANAPRMQAIRDNSKLVSGADWEQF